LNRSDHCRDERDRPFLDLMATAPPPDYFVTGDKDFEASQYSGVPVISAAAFARLLKHR
jgi:predicted nucleic acid-binding protein